MITEFRQAFAHWQIAAAWTIFLARYFVFAFGRQTGNDQHHREEQNEGAELNALNRVLRRQYAKDDDHRHGRSIDLRRWEGT